MVASHEIATLYVSIVPETSKIAPGLKKEFSQIERSGKSVGSRLGDVIGTGVKRAAQGAGLAAGALLGTALTKGLGRLAAIDTAEAKLTGLGHSASSVAGIMDDALASVKGTAFGLGEAGAAAASAVASGVKPGKDLQRTLKLMGDAAAIAGTDLNSMASIFNKVSSTGKLQGDVLAQLGERGIPIIALLAETMGVATSEVAKLGAEGKIGFEDLQNAIEHGMGGAALAVGDTFVGAMDNAGAALGRLGAEATKPFFDGAITGVKTFTTVVDSLTSKVGPLAQALYDRLAPAAKTAGDFVEDTLVPGIRTVGEYAAMGMPTIQNFASSLTSMIGPAMTIGEALMDVAASLGVSSWEALLTVLDITAGLMTSAVVPGLNVVADVLDSSSIAALAFGTALVGLTKGKTVLDGLQRSGAWMEKRAGTMADFGQAAKETAASMQSFSRAHPEVTRLGVATKILGDNGQTGFAKITAGADRASQRVAAFGDAHRLAAMQAKAQALASTDAFTSIDRMGSQAWHGTVAAASTATQGIAASLGGLKGAGMAAFDGIKAGAGGLMTMMGGPFGVAMAGAAAAVGYITAAYTEAQKQAKDMARATSEVASSQDALLKHLIATRGALGEDGIAHAAKMANANLNLLKEQGDNARGFSNLWRGVATATGLSTEAFRENHMAARENESVYNDIENSARAMGMTMDDVGEAVAIGGARYIELKDRLMDLGYTGERATEILEGLRDEQAKLADEARRTTPSSAEVAEALKNIGNRAGDATSRIDGLWNAIQKMRGQAPDMAESGRALGDEIDNIAQKLNVAEGETSEFAGAVLNANGTVDSLGGASSRAASEAVENLTKRMRDAVAAGHDVQTIYDMGRASLDALGAAAGWSAEDVDLMTHAMQATPRDLQILATAETDTAVANILSLQEHVDAYGTGLIGKKFYVEGGPEAVAELEKIGVKVSEYNEKTGLVTIDAVTDEARRKMVEILDKAGEVENTPREVRIGADTTEAEAGIDGVNIDLDMLDDRGATPTAGLDRTAFDGAVMGADQALMFLDDRFAVAGAGLDTAALDVSAWGAQTTLTGIDDRHVVPSSDLDNALLDGNANTAHGTLNVLDGQRPTPIADLNNDGVRTGVDRATEWIRNFIREFANTVINMSVNVAGFVRTVFTGGDGAANGGTIGALASGGSIRDLTGGGQLPTSGPGTHVTDGFLGVDRGGMPIVRVDAGEEVITAKQAQKHRRLLKAINRGDPRIDDLPGFETGGSIGSREGLDRALREAQSSHDAGASYVWGGHARTGSDCSGFVSRVAWTAQGVDPDSVGRMGNTTTMMAGQWPGFRRGRFGPFIVGVNSEHMAATIDGIPVESGGDVGGPSVGEGDGANDSQFTEHWSMDHGAFSPPYSNAPVEASGTIYDGGTPVAPSVSGGNDRVVPLEDSTAQKVEKASQDENSIFYGTGADTWSDLGGNIAKTAVSGQLSSLLKVLGIPDEMPPLVQAGKTWMQKVKDDASAQDIEKGDAAVAEQAAKELDNVEPFDRGGIAQGKGVLKKDVAEPERVLDPSQTRAFDELVAEITKSGVTSAVSAGAGALEAYVPGIGAVAGPAGDAAGWYAGEVSKNLMSTASTFAQDITGIGGAVMGGMVPITTPQVTAPAPVMPVAGSGGGGEIHFHVADMREAMHKARQIQAREARGLVGTRR